ncbi:sterol desaturase family protein [Olivibacter sitiensis]|uniref:sterol desaturase family protein n=1 Tax=Olivibacter sitiensis TaxID=376470 RepID=UPI000410B445|nr:sterol desaturase family protein [Olivibacter sitiensis]
MAKNYVSNSEESTRMFKSDLLEPLTKVHFSVPIIIYLPVIVYFVFQAFNKYKLDVLHFVGYFALGLVIWSLTEYVLHRFVFHFTPKGKFMERIHFIFHGVHHDYPQDRLRLVMPPVVSIPLALLFYFLFKWLLGEAYVSAFFPAFMIGYLFYDIGHYAMHHYNFKSGLMKKIKQHHMLHHYADADKGYGVSSPFWDKIFGSDFPKKNKKI